MKFKFSKLEQMVGGFIILSVFLLLITIILINLNKKMFIKKYFYKTQFTSGEGLSKKPYINYKGFKIGKVTKFDFDTRTQLVDVVFYIEKKYNVLIVEYSVLDRTANFLTRDVNIELKPGPDFSKTVNEHSLVPSLDTEEGQAILKAGLVKKEGLVDDVTRVVANVNDVLTGLSDLLDGLKKDYNPEDGSLYRTLFHVANMSEKYDRAFATIFQTLERVNSTTNNLKIMSEELSNVDGLVVRMLDPDGSKIFNPLEVLMQRVNKSLTDIQEITSYLNDQTPQIANLLETGRATLEETKDVMEGIKNNPLIRSGISKKKEQKSLVESMRNTDF